MKLNPWYIYPDIYEPTWDPDDQKLVWNESSATLIYLPSFITTAEEVQELLEHSYTSEHGSSTCLWHVREW
jgi:hypothetical protein